MSLSHRVQPLIDKAHELADHCHHQLNAARSAFDAAQAIALDLGAHYSDDVTTFGFWTPELLDQRIPEGDVFVEVLSPHDELDLIRSHQEVTFDRVRIPAVRYESYTFAAATGVKPGCRDQTGDFYALTWRDAEGHWHRIFDPLAMSLPFGAFAPAELYDVDRMQAARLDGDFFRHVANGQAKTTIHKFTAPTNILQIHVPTATAGGTLASLTRQFERLAERYEQQLPSEPVDELFLGYDAVQLLPVEPTTIYETEPNFWIDDDADEGPIQVSLTRPDTTNWGYDVVISGMATVNPVLLESGRPDELVDFAAVLHNFPGKPKMLILDLVFGHSDNQGLKALNPHYFAGPNMYGQNLDFRNPAVRAILLEMQRRKVNFGADGVRVDGAQDFQYWDAQELQMIHDDDFLQSMADVVQTVANVSYRPWMIFEDGRPWPEEDWELASSYRSVIEKQRDGDVFQWGPLTFAHNTPFIYTFWLAKYWRIQDILEHGSHWISGTANHDTLRRGTQVDPRLNINTRLGETRMEILDKAYDNPAEALLTYVALPGVPMDFLNARARASWGFVRNQDDLYGVKVVAEEAISLKWLVDDYSYSMPLNFRRLKALGFETRDDLSRFLKFLPALVEVTEYDLDEIARLLTRAEPTLAGPETFTEKNLKQIARAWMDDMHEYCNVANSLSLLDATQTQFMLSVRNFRRENPWLVNNYSDSDHFEYLRPTDGKVVFASLRHGPNGQQVFTLVHMEGGPTSEFDPLRLKIPGIEGFGWKLKLKTPVLSDSYIGGPLILEDSTGVVYVRGFD
ncbi:MAG: hypothetical protein MI976_07780 [Pseudomonadales bacterium]|nr:hypothetical protein [Pseudomonadales bacterium]